MNFSDFQESTKSPEPVYLLVTNQEYIEKKVYQHCREQVQEGARSFDWSVFDLKRDGVEDLLNTARTLPWMTPLRWVYSRNTQVGDQKKLIAYLKQPSPRSVVVLAFDRRPSGWPKVKVPVIEEDLSESDLVQWIRDQAKEAGCDIEPQAAQALLELVGENLQLLKSELEKQALWQLKDRRITLESVLRMTFQTRQYDVFALIDAIAECQPQRALQILHRLYDCGARAPQILSVLYWNFRRLLVAREMLDQGRPFRSILAQLRIWTYKNKERQLRNYSRSALIRVLIQLSETEHLLKTTATNPQLQLELVIVDTCQKTSL